MSRNIPDEKIISMFEVIMLRLEVLEGKADKIMALADDLKAAIAELDAETTLIGTRIDALVAQLGNSSLSDQEKADIFAALKAESDRLKTLGTSPTTPVPPVPPALAAARKK